MARLAVSFLRKLGCPALLCPVLLFAARLAAAPGPNVTGPGVVPADRLGEPWWAARHASVVAAAQAHPDTQLLLIGDSITNNYDKSKLPDENFQPTWQQFYAPRKALNLGFSGDTTANVLWRLDHGEVAGLHPKVALVLIGTNNTGVGNQTAEQTEDGIDAVVGSLEQHLPATHLLLLAILPSAISASKSMRDSQVNGYLALRYGEDRRVTYLDVGSVLLKDGTPDPAIYYDPRLPQQGRPLHPDTRGQRRMAEAIEPTLARCMGDAPRLPLAAMTESNTALIPVPRLELDSYDWYARHHEELALERTLAPEVVLIGDSITHFWSGPPKAARASGGRAWQKTFGSLPVLNMGFGWDRTQNVLWRLQQGELRGVEPRSVVLAIGTNNLTGTANARANTPAEVAEGIEAIVREVQARLPQSRIVVMAIFPRGPRPDDPMRGPILATNRLLAEKFARALKQPNVTYLDIGSRFLQPDGTLSASLMPDGTHPSDAGYQIWGNALHEVGVGVPATAAPPR